jgi:hypothetical protein
MVAFEKAVASVITGLNRADVVIVAVIIHDFIQSVELEVDYKIITCNTTTRAYAWAIMERWESSATARAVWGDTALRASIEAEGVPIPLNFRVTDATAPSWVAFQPTTQPTSMPTSDDTGDTGATTMTAPTDDGSSGIHDLTFELLLAACCAIVAVIGGYVQRKVIQRMCSASKMNTLAAGQRALALHEGDAVLRQTDVQHYGGIAALETKLQTQPAKQLVWVIRGFDIGSLEKEPSTWLIRIEGPFTAEDAARITLTSFKSPRLRRLRTSNADDEVAHLRVSEYLRAQSEPRTQGRQRGAAKPRIDSSYMASQVQKVPFGFGLSVKDQPPENPLRTQLSSARLPNQMAAV